MKVHHYSKALSWITRPRVTETATLETFTPELDRMDFNPGGRVGMKPGGLVEPGVTHYGDYEDPNYKKKWYQKHKERIADKYQENKESISKQRKEKYEKLTPEERLAKSRSEQQPPEKRAKTYKKRVLAKMDLSPVDLKVLDRFKLNLTYSKNMNEIIQEHGGTRPSKEDTTLPTSRTDDSAGCCLAPSLVYR